MLNQINAENAVAIVIADEMDKETALNVVKALATKFDETVRHYSDALHKLAIEAIKFGIKFDDATAVNLTFNSVPASYRKAMRVYLSEFSPFVWSKDGKAMINRPAPMKLAKMQARLERARQVSPTDFLKAVKAKDEPATKAYNDIVKSVSKRLESIIKDAGLNARDIATLQGALDLLGKNNATKAVEPETKAEPVLTVVANEKPKASKRILRDMSGLAAAM